MKTHAIALALLCSVAANAQPYTEVSGVQITQSQLVITPLESGHAIWESRVTITNASGVNLNNLHLVVVTSVMGIGSQPGLPATWSNATGRWTQNTVRCSGGLSAISHPRAIPERFLIAWTNLPRAYTVLNLTTRFTENDAPMSWSIGDVRRGETIHASLYFDVLFNPIDPPPTWFVDLRTVHVPVAICLADVDDGSGRGIPDGGVTIDDLLSYLGLFIAGDQHADMDDGSSSGTPDGGVTIEDLLYFLVRYEVGC